MHEATVTADKAHPGHEQAQHRTQVIGSLELAHSFLGATIQTLRWTPQDAATATSMFRIFEQRMSEARELLQKLNNTAEPAPEAGGSLPN